MSCFTTMSAVTAGETLDLTKHVNYTAGMILGVDDFTQEFAYLAGRDRWLARDAIGYGTISGLSVKAEKDGDKGWRVMVSPGVAISPRGQLICVSSAQCAYLNQWLAAADAKDLADHIKTASPPSSSPPGDDELTLYVVLCYRDCPTDNVPIPGEPCRDESELSAPSRIKDDFSLELRFEHPNQAEEEAVRIFVRWLKEIDVVEIGASSDLDDFEQAIRARWLANSSPPITSPPTTLQINSDDLSEYMRVAFRIWVTELRNVLSERKSGCSVEMSGEDCVLLAEVRIPLTELSEGWEASDLLDTTVNEDGRPFLVHLRMLQEWLLGSLSMHSEHMPILSPPVQTAHNHSLALLSDVAFLSSPTDGQVLIFKNGTWTAETPTTSGGTTDHGALSGLGDDDHTQYLLVDGSRALTGNLDGGTKRITNLAAGNANGHAVIFQQAIKQNDSAGGDLSGSYPNPLVTQIRGRALSNQAPTNGDALVFNGTAWIPQQISSTPSKDFLLLPLATITRRDNNLYEVWFNIDAPGNLAEIKALNTDNMKIADETDAPAPFLVDIRFATRKLVRNAFFVQLTLDTNQPEPNFMRFSFNVNKIAVSFRNTELTLLDYAASNDIKFEGYLKGEFATLFVRGTGERQ